MKPLRELGRLLLLLLGGVLLSTLLMLGVYALPAAPAREHVRASAELLGEEGLVSYAIPGYAPSRLDNFTDALMLSGAVLAPYDTLSENAMLCERFSGYDPLFALLRFLDGDAPKTEPYSRYWHGYLVVLKPLLFFFSVGSIRYLFSALGILLALLLAGKLFRGPGGRGGVLALFALLAALCPPALMDSLHYAPCPLIALFSGLLLPQKFRRAPAPAYFLLIGMATAFFDFLTFPILTLVLPLSLYAIQSEEPRLSRLLPPLFMAAAAWCLGYAGLWAGKWAAGSLLTGRNLMTDALRTLETRTAARDVEGDAVSIFSGFFACLRVLFSPISAAALLCALAALLPFSLRARFVQGEGGGAKRLCLLLIAALPVLWTLAACNHSLEHSFFAYRTLAASFFPLTLAAAPLRRVDSPSPF